MGKGTEIVDDEPNKVVVILTKRTKMGEVKVYETRKTIVLIEILYVTNSTDREESLRIIEKEQLLILDFTLPLHGENGKDKHKVGIVFLLK